VTAVHHGADDNASGTAAMLEVARSLAARRSELRRDVVVAAFSGEEAGLLGSTALTRHPPPGSSSRASWRC
jgi:Zn-dependent M28 family amino/carboxypeptidase